MRYSQPSSSRFIRRTLGYITRTAFTVMSLLIGTLLVIGWAVLVVTTEVCKSMWIRGWELLFAITCGYPMTRLMRHRSSS